MSLESVTVRREQPRFGRGKNLSSETQGVSTETITRVVPSICKKGNISDGLVNAKITIENGGEVTYLYVTESASTIIALDD